MSNINQPKVHIKFISVTVACTLIFQLFFPTFAWANSGDSQAQQQSFTPSGVTNMVNLFTGDLNYNIPLLDVEGYPISLSYSGDVGMNTDASWVGLGWSCSPGFINREMRGLPDDFNNDLVTQKINIKEEEETKNSFGTYRRWNSFIPIVGGNWSNTKETNFSIFNSAYDGGGIEKSISKTTTSGDFFSDNGRTEATIYNTHKGFSFSETTFNTDHDFPMWPSFMNSETTSRTLFYNSRMGLTHIQRSAGTSSQFSWGKFGAILDAAITLISFGASAAAGSCTTAAGKAAVKAVSTIATVAGYAMMFGPQMSSSSNGFSTITTGTPTYTPSVSLETFRASVKTGGRIGTSYLFYASGGTGEYSASAMNNINAVKSVPAVGFLNSSSYLYNSQIYTHGIFDLNREDDGIYYETMPNLPVTNATYDVYHVRSEGMIGDYRAFRNDVGSFNSPTTQSAGVSLSLINSYEQDNIIQSQTTTNTFSLSKTKTGSDVWENPGNNAPENLQFTDGIVNTEYEPYYFKNIGEKQVYKEAFYDLYGGDQPAQVKYLNSPHFSGPPSDFIFKYAYSPLIGVGTDAKLEVKDPQGVYADISIPSSRNTGTLKDKREQRNSLFIEKKAGDNVVNFTDPAIIDYLPYNEITNPSGDIVVNGTTLRATHPSHHSSEIVVKNDVGGKYVYGIPVYNNLKKNVSFNVTGNTLVTPLTNEQVTYSGTDNSSGNTKGYNQYFNSTDVPKYASAYLLTAIINNDYIDVQGDGLTADDYGSYTKFNYSKLPNEYHWRTPYESNTANYSTVHHAYDDDQKGSYSYGKKEIWNVHSIESKNFIAEFYTSDRDDAVSVVGENGGLGTVKLKKLDQIKLYAKEDRLKNGSSAVPIKTVHFEYDYTQCLGIPSNATGGKLTLQEVYFTYGNSDKGKESVYKFNYSDLDHDGTEDVNFSYAPNNVDRWGDYKPNSTSLLNSEFPFTPQNDRETADEYAAAWRLTQIITPEGSNIDIYYEADDYATVQDKRAMQMFMIEGTDVNVNNSFDPGSMTPSNTLYSGSINNNIIYFKLQDDITTGTPTNAKEELDDDYFAEIEHLYFKSFVELSPGTGIKEYVEGYAKIDDYGVVGTSAPYSYGWIKLNSSFYNGNQAGVGSHNPISMAGWQSFRTTIPRVYRDLSTWASDFIALQVIKSGQATTGVMYKNRSLADNLELGKSWIRLLNPNKAKVGGGYRVSKVMVYDNWGDMGGTTDFYGQTYDYTILNNDKVESSGVAAYEPHEGREENSWRTPVFYVKNNQNIPSDFLYQETPFGESHFPAPMVGYSSVKVKNLVRTDVTNHASGYTVNKFYTAKDFPTIVDRTKKDLSKFAYTPTNSQLVIGVPTINHSFSSQGFVIKKNDMHGQNKGSEIYNEGGSLISKSTVYYKSNLINGNTYQLDNEATVINNDGTISEAIIGKDIDIFNSYRESYDEDAFSSTTSGRTYSIFSLFGLLGKIKSKSVSKSSKRLYTTVLTKVINQYGLVDRIETEDLGTKKTLKNLAYDAETGNLLLTSVQNEYSDEIFNFTYPAHWHYDNLGQGYKNINLALSGLSSPLSPHDGIISLTATSVAYFSVGDKLLLTYGSSPTTEEAWVLEIDKFGNSITCIDIDGDLIPFTVDPISLKIIESGRNNMQNLPIGSVTTLTNPIAGSNLAFSDVIQSSAIELTDDWTTICEPILIDLTGYVEQYSLISPGQTINPFTEGIQGKWRMNKTYSYNQSRNLTSTSTASNLREDGTYTTFKPFWDFSASGKLVPIYDADYPPSPTYSYEKWKKNTEVTRYNRDGKLIETKDILDRTATSLYGYSPTLKNVPVAIASNANQKDIAFDGFEDYDYFNDPGFLDFPGHFNFSIGANLLIDEDNAHTGIKSIKIAPGSSHMMGKGIRPDCSSEEFTEGYNYLVKPCDCELQFSPTEGKYIVSAWVKQDVGIPGTAITYAKIEVDEINIGYTSIYNISLQPSGPVIDGWQRIEGEIEVVTGTKGISLKLKNTGLTDAYFDDVRIHPFNSAMKTMVYHPDNLRLMAELDNRNYSTFFEYDEEGTLVRIKKETEKGIVTIKETRSSIVKNP